MGRAKRWHVQVFIDEHNDDSTRAEIRLDTGDTRLIAVGTARRNPGDQSVPEIGDELAVARALLELAHQLLDATAKDIEGFTHHPVHLEQ